MSLFLFNTFKLKMNENDGGGSDGNAALKMAHDIFDPIDPNLVNNFLQTDPTRTMDIANKLLMYANSIPDQDNNAADIINIRKYITDDATKDIWLEQLDAWALTQQQQQVADTGSATDQVDGNSQVGADNVTNADTVNNAGASNLNNNSGTAGADANTNSGTGNGTTNYQLINQNGDWVDTTINTNTNSNTNADTYTSAGTDAGDTSGQTDQQNETHQNTTTEINAFANSTLYQDALFYLNGVMNTNDINQQFLLNNNQAEAFVKMIYRYQENHFSLIHDDNRQQMHDWIVDQASSGNNWVNTIQSWYQNHYDQNDNVAINTSVGYVSKDALYARYTQAYAARAAQIDPSLAENFDSMDFTDPNNLKYKLLGSTTYIDIATENRLLSYMVNYWQKTLSDYQQKSQSGRASQEELLDIPVIQNIINFSLGAQSRYSELAAGMSTGAGYVLQLTPEDLILKPTSTRTVVSMCTSYGERWDPKTIAITYAGPNASAERLAVINEYIRNNPMTWYFDFYNGGGGGAHLPSGGGGGSGGPDLSDAFGGGDPFNGLNSIQQQYGLGAQTQTTRQAEYDRLHPNNNPDGTGYQRDVNQNQNNNSSNSGMTDAERDAFNNANRSADGEVNRTYYTDGSWSDTSQTTANGVTRTWTTTYNADGSVFETTFSDDVQAASGAGSADNNQGSHLGGSNPGGTGHDAVDFNHSPSQTNQSMLRIATTALGNNKDVQFTIKDSQGNSSFILDPNSSTQLPASYELVVFNSENTETRYVVMNGEVKTIDQITYNGNQATISRTHLGSDGEPISTETLNETVTLRTGSVEIREGQTTDGATGLDQTTGQTEPGEMNLYGTRYQNVPENIITRLGLNQSVAANEYAQRAANIILQLRPDAAESIWFDSSHINYVASLVRSGHEELIAPYLLEGKKPVHISEPGFSPASAVNNGLDPNLRAARPDDDPRQFVRGYTDEGVAFWVVDSTTYVDTRPMIARVFSAIDSYKAQVSGAADGVLDALGRMAASDQTNEERLEAYNDFKRNFKDLALDAVVLPASDLIGTTDLFTAVTGHNLRLAVQPVIDFNTGQEISSEVTGQQRLLAIATTAAVLLGFKFARGAGAADDAGRAALPEGTAGISTKTVSRADGSLEVTVHAVDADGRILSRLGQEVHPNAGVADDVVTASAGTADRNLAGATDELGGGLNNATNNQVNSAGSAVTPEFIQSAESVSSRAAGFDAKSKSIINQLHPDDQVTAIVIRNGDQVSLSGRADEIFAQINADRTITNVSIDRIDVVAPNITPSQMAKIDNSLLGSGDIQRIKVTFASGESAMASVDDALMMRLAQDPNVVSIGELGNSPLMRLETVSDQMKRAGFDSEGYRFAQIPQDRVLTTRSAEFNDITLTHGTLEGHVPTVMAGPKNVGGGFGGDGLYVTVESAANPDFARYYAGAAQQGAAEGAAAQAGVQQTRGVVMIGTLNPDLNLTVGVFELSTRPTDLSRGILNVNWSQDPILKKTLEGRFNILDLRGSESNGIANLGDRFLVVHESAGPNAIVWRRLETESGDLVSDLARSESGAGLANNTAGNNVSAVVNDAASSSVGNSAIGGSATLYTTFASSVAATGLIAAQNLPPEGNYMNYLGRVTDADGIRLPDPTFVGSVLGLLHGESRNTIVIEAHSSGVLLTDHSTGVPRQVPITELVQQIKSNPNYDPNVAIVLNACHTGSLAANNQSQEFLAQALSRHLPNRILGPDGTAEYNPLTNSTEVVSSQGQLVGYNKFNAFRNGVLVEQQEWTYGQSAGSDDRGGS